MGRIVGGVGGGVGEVLDGGVGREEAPGGFLRWRFCLRDSGVGGVDSSSEVCAWVVWLLAVGIGGARASTLFGG